MLSERVRPTKIGSMIGNEQSRLELVKWLKHWKVGSKPVLLSGPPGVGKSTSVYAVAKEFGYTVIEYNASDVRTRERLREALSPTLENASVFGKDEKLLVFLDEIDGLLG
ncbi:MAG: AAA family ATPase, partial [Nitrososphaerales archaeon]